MLSYGKWHSIKGVEDVSNVPQDDHFNNVIISENLKRLRLQRNLTTTQVAKILKKTRQGYLNYETGAREIGIHDLIKLSGYYDVPIDAMVGNPHQGIEKAGVSYRTYIISGGELQPIKNTMIQHAFNEIICVKYDDQHTDFFWRTSVYHKNCVMIFEFYSKVYVSKVFFNTDGSGCFFIGQEPHFFSKAHADNVFYLGVFAATLQKEFTIPGFF